MTWRGLGPSTCEWRPDCGGDRVGDYCGVPVCLPCYEAAFAAGARVSITEKLRRARRDAGDDFAVTYDEALLGFTVDG